MRKLTETFIRNLQHSGANYPDHIVDSSGFGLALRVQPSGSKQWVQRVTLPNGKRTAIGLGSYPIVTLAEARDQAFENKRKLRQGIDIVAKRKAPRIPTFREALDAYIKLTRGSWRHPEKTAGEWKSSFENHILPHVGNGDWKVNQISTPDLMNAISKIWTKYPDSARRTLQRIVAVFEWCEAKGHVSGNPAASLRRALPKQRVQVQHFEAIPVADMPDAVAKIQEAVVPAAIKLATEFLILTAARSGEVRMATWAEVDSEARTWTIPASRTKTSKAHAVPLSDRAIEVLREAETLRDGTSDLVFPGIWGKRQTGKPIGERSFQRTFDKCELAGKPHGCRSTFRDWCAENGVSREVAEAALAHKVRGVEGAYFRSDLLERRRRVMAAWADYCAGVAAAEGVSSLGQARKVA